MIDHSIHKSFDRPAGNPTLWRYMDVTKFIDLLERQALFFCRSDLLGDPWEGTIAGLTARQVAQNAERQGIPTEVLMPAIGSDGMRAHVFVNCWHANEYESAAMWKVYLQSSEGIAVRTDHSALLAALEPAPHVIRSTMIRYIDYETESFPITNAFWPFVHKRRSFQHEHELRLVFWASEDRNQALAMPGSSGVSIPIDVRSMIRAVHVAPTSPKWLCTLIEKIMVRYEMSSPVVRSNLYDSPVR